MTNKTTDFRGAPPVDRRSKRPSPRPKGKSQPVATPAPAIRKLETRAARLKRLSLERVARHRERQKSDRAIFYIEAGIEDLAVALEASGMIVPPDRSRADVLETFQRYFRLKLGYE